MKKHQLSYLKVRDWRPPNAKIDVNEATYALRKFYCWGMKNNGLCPVECEQCKDRIVEMLSLEVAKKPIALLTYRAKDMVAKVVDEQMAKEEAKSTLVEEAVSDIGNIFDDLIEIMEANDEGKT